jgi:NAD(P)H dehydrogenase (quinone)
VKVLVVIAHPNPKSFCHAVLGQVTQGLRDGGHRCEVVDLHAIGFDPVFRDRDYNQFMHESLPDELIAGIDLKEAVVARAGGRARQALAKRWMRDKSNREIVEALGKRTPRDVRHQQEKVARAEGLIFIAPIYWMGLPAILKGWFERVFAYGFAYTLDRDGWNGHLDGRVPLLTQQKGLIITPTFFTKDEYERGGWEESIDAILCDWGLKMAGVKEAHHVYLHAVSAVDHATRRDYLDQAYRLGMNFATERDVTEAAITPGPSGPAASR